MTKKLRMTLGTQFVVMILTMGLVLSASAMLVTYQAYQSRNRTAYRELGLALAKTAASQLDPDSLDRYYGTGETDEAYWESLAFLRDLAESGGVPYIYVVRPHDKGMTYLFDTDTKTVEDMDYTTGGNMALGTYWEFPEGDAFGGYMDQFLAGEEIGPIVDDDEIYGRIMTVMTPVLHADGRMAAYVMVDFYMSDVNRVQNSFLLTVGGILAALTAAFTALYVVVARRSFIQPVRLLTAAAKSYEGGEDVRAFSGVKIKGSPELRALADAFRMMLVEIRVNNMDQQELMMREQKLAADMDLANDLNAAMLPKGLPQRQEGEYPFEVRGRSQQGQELASCFYDYFLLDQDRLCLIIGETPGSGVPQALYTVMAEATIKSHLTSGLSLTEAMSVSNRQLYEMGSELYMSALVGILDGTTGHFSCINAGQRDPLLMRSQDRYEWLESFSFAPLGQNENVVYRTLELDLRQGDRLFFHTGGLDEILGQDGREFAAEQLRLTLNEKKTREAGLIDQMKQVSDAGGVYAARSSQIKGYALLTLEFIRRDRAQAHCVVTPDAAGASALQKFLRGQMEANGIGGREMSQFMVLSDELFALCRRGADEDARFMAECTVSPEERLAVLRLNGPMRGRDPMDRPEGDPDYPAAAFIRQNAEQVSFSHEAFMDTVLLVKRLERRSAAQAG